MWLFLSMSNQVDGSHICILTRVLRAVKPHFTLLAAKEVGHINLIPIIDGSIREKSIYAGKKGFVPQHIYLK